MKRLAGARLATWCVLLIVKGAGGQTPDVSKEWPTYGHDPGGMRFSPLTRNHAGECRPAQGGVGLSHEACRRRRARRPGRGRRRRGRHAGSAGAQGGRGRGRGGSGFRAERSHAAGDQRNDVYVHAVFARGGGGPDHRQGNLGFPAARRHPFDARRRNTGPATRRRRRRSSSARATASCIRWMPRPESPTTPLATTASSI